MKWSRLPMDPPCSGLRKTMVQAFLGSSYGQRSNHKIEPRKSNKKSAIHQLWLDLLGATQLHGRRRRSAESEGSDDSDLHNVVVSFQGYQKQQKTS